MPDLITNDMICTVCPLGCRLTLEKDGEGYVVKGNQCKRGEAFAIEEFTRPTRMLTTTVRLTRSRHARLPVHSASPLPRDMLFRAMEAINACGVAAPVRTGQVVIGNILGTGVDICSSRDVDQ
ncbi:MAG: DUF1667 domain-containing protein [Candidatus Marinimicrobia bacterium]|nr:DUF1667 domain-containing protein [Candidatus Neomarinimicrobiota bacterium]